MKILLTNDDGFDAPGLSALYEAICDISEIHVVAPAQVESSSTAQSDRAGTTDSSPRAFTSS